MPTIHAARIVRLVRTDPWALAALAALVGVAVFVRPVLLRHVPVEGRRTKGTSG